MKRLVLGAAAAVAGGLAAGWTALVKRQGDSRMVFEPETLSGLHGDARTMHGEITVVNRGKAGGVVHKLEGRLVSGPPGRVLVTRKDSRVPVRGWWRSNCLVPGESCVAEVDIDLESPATEPVTIELDIHEVGRRLKVHRVLKLEVEPLPAPGVPTAAP